MKNKKIILFSAIILIVVVISTIAIINFINDENRLTVEEKQWLNNNKNNVVSLNINNELNVFSKNGEGVYYDFLDSFSKENEIQVNPVTFGLDDNNEGLSFGYFFDKKDNIIFYEDTFVLVSKDAINVNDIKDINVDKIITFNKYLDYVKKYNTNETVEFEGFDSEEELFNSFNDNNYFIALPKIMYLDKILNSDYHIIYHMSDAKIYYGVTNDNSVLFSIIKKYFSNWNDEYFLDSFNTKELNLFTANINISASDLANIRSKTYNYGVVNNYPYEIISGGTYGGINAVYLKKFADFSDIKLEFVKLKNKEKLTESINEGKTNLYFDFYNDLKKYNSVNSHILIDYAVLVNNDNSLVVNSLNSLEQKDVYIEKDSYLLSYLKDITGNKLSIKTYDADDLNSVVKDDEIIIMDVLKFESLKDGLLSDYSIRYSVKTDNSYSYRVENSVMASLMSRYFETLDNKEMNYLGINNYMITKKTGIIMGTFAKYFLLLLVVVVVVAYFVYRKTKKIKIAKKIKKEDKMRFIDQLTSLKNRNYLTENLENWNKNTIYPQAIIMLDLNKLQEINDTVGYEQGDDQIKAAANILVKTQLDRTDIIRTNGNEFLIYLVGYEVKQVTSYIHKLNREFKKLPFDYGVAIGYSMITDDVKSIEDATNEAVEQVKEQKENKKDE